MSDIKAVFWDFGGVVTSSPFDNFRRFEQENGYPLDIIKRVNAINPDSNAWAQMERSEISREEFDVLFAEESAVLGARIPGSLVLPLIAGEIRPQVVAAIRKLKGQRHQACLTNNVKVGHGPNMQGSSEGAKKAAEAFGLFDFVLESAKAGARKPEPAFYKIALDHFGLEPTQVVFLDDLGINLKPARAMGMHTIKVAEPEPALRALSEYVGMDLLS